MRILGELQAPNPVPAWAGLRATTRPTAATTGRALHGRRAARVQHASHGAQGGHALRLPARWGHGWPRARAATAAGARFHDRRGAATHGDPIVAHPSTSVRALGRFRGRARRADGRTGCAWTARGARCARGRQKMPDYRPAGAFFLQSPPGSMKKTRSRNEKELLELRVLLLKMDALLQLQYITAAFTLLHRIGRRQSFCTAACRAGSQARMER